VPDPALANPGDLIGYLQRDVEGDVTTLLDMVSGVVRAYCGWHVAPVREADEVTVDGSGTRQLALPTLHLLDVAAITEDGATVDPAGVQFSEAGYLWRPECWTRALRGVTATIDHGYDPVPPEVVAVVLALAARLVNNPTGAATWTRTIGPFTTTINYGTSWSGAALSTTEQFILDRYKIPGRP
jgi:hypothetical protein